MRMQHVEKEITSPVLLCDQKGQLNPDAIGFARRPLIQSNLTKNFMRKKKWNNWSIFGEDILFSATVSHLDYAVICFVYLFNYETQRFSEKQISIPLGRVKMPENVLESVYFKHNHLTMKMFYEDNETKISVQIPNFDNEVLQAELYIYHPPEDDSLNVVIPNNRNIFQLTSKKHIMPTTGFVKLGDKCYHFTSDYSFAIANYGRGIWPRHTNWNWAMASQRIGHRRVGLNFGGQWTDGTGMTENAIFIDGKMLKIHEDVIFTYNLQKPKEPWIIKTKFSDNVHLTFTPFFTKMFHTDIKLFRSNTCHLVGYYNGRVALPGYAPLDIRQMLGYAEEHHAKW